jgi:hypothetical protein
MRYHLFVSCLMGLGLAIAVVGCRRGDESQIDTPSPAEHEARRPPEFSATPTGKAADANQLLAEAMRKAQANLPAGHPPIDNTLPAGHPPIGNTAGGSDAGNSLPPGHPPIGQQSGAVAFSGDLDEPEQMLKFDVPAGWVAKPARAMTVAIYALPNPSGAREDADLAISHYPGMKNIPLQQQIDRWAGQFTQPNGGAGEAFKQTQLESTAHPTTLVDISGTYSAGSMMGPAGPPQENYRMMSAIVETEQGPWFFKLTGPAETVAAHEREFVEMLRQAK